MGEAAASILSRCAQWIARCRRLATGASSYGTLCHCRRIRRMDWMHRDADSSSVAATNAAVDESGVAGETHARTSLTHTQEGTRNTSRWKKVVDASNS